MAPSYSAELIMGPDRMKEPNGRWRCFFSTARRCLEGSAQSGRIIIWSRHYDFQDEGSAPGGCEKGALFGCLLLFYKNYTCTMFVYRFLSSELLVFKTSPSFVALHLLLSEIANVLPEVVYSVTICIWA